MGKALYAAQGGETDPAAKPLRGFEMAKKSTKSKQKKSKTKSVKRVKKSAGKKK